MNKQGGGRRENAAVRKMDTSLRRKKGCDARGKGRVRWKRRRDAHRGKGRVRWKRWARKGTEEEKGRTPREKAEDENLKVSLHILGYRYNFSFFFLLKRNIMFIKSHTVQSPPPTYERQHLLVSPRSRLSLSSRVRSAESAGRRERQMVQLCLSLPPSGVSRDADAVKERISLFESLGSVIWSVLTSGGRYEPRLWLCNTISSVRSIDHRGQRKLFIDLLDSTPSKRDVAAQLLRMIFDKSPGKAGAVLAKRCYILEKFFEGNPRRILQWFDHFAATGEFGHKKGARAMSQFAFINRDICWEELEWKGRHGQSPAVVATKPHYFHDLDVLRTVENFLEHVPEFWSSDELAESVKDGDILHIDTEFFVDQFIHLMYEKGVEDIWDMIDEFLVEQQFSSLCQHLLVLLNECELHAFLDSLSKCLSGRQNFEDIGHSSSWLEILLSSNTDPISLDDFLLLNAIISHARQIVRLLGDDEHETEERKIEKLLKISTGYSDADHWSLMMECTKLELFFAMKCIGLQSWILRYVLSKECKTKEYCESLFINNGISFKKSSDYSLICSNGLSEGSGPDDDNAAYFVGGYRKRKRSKKKKKSKKYVHKEAGMDELIDFDGSNRLRDSHLGNGRWFLSTDGFSRPWYMADLPEHLSRHSFSFWMKWVCSMRN